MNFEEHAAKSLLRAAGIPTPQGEVAATPAQAREIAEKIGPCAIKAQIPAGKRGKGGGIALAETTAEAETAARRILGSEIAGHVCKKVLIEQRVSASAELYAAVLNDPATKRPLLLFSPEGGMDIEEIAAEHPDKLARIPVDISGGPDLEAVRSALAETGEADRDAVANLLLRLYDAYASNDAELVEINPLALAGDGSLIALDGKFVLDDSAIKRQGDLAKLGSPEKLTALESEARGLGLNYIELDGDIGVLANGAGLTMTTMDAIRHYGGSPANFLEIGGEAYTLGKAALGIVTANSRIKSLLVNFCGAFARTDVMVEGLLSAWDDAAPRVPAFFTIHGTGEDEAVAMVSERLGIEPYDVMDDAVKAAVEATAR